METKVQVDNTIDKINLESKMDNVTSEDNNENEPTIKKPKLNENIEEIKSKEDEKSMESDKNIEQGKNDYRECKILGDDDTDDEIEFNKDGILYFLDRLTTTKTTHAQKLEEFKEYLEADISNERDRLRLPKKGQASIEQKQEEKDKESDDEEKWKKNKNDSDDEEVSMEYETPEEGFNYPLEMDASDMLDEVDLNDDGCFPSVTERYFTPYYAIDVKEPCDDVCILIHSNRVCMITLAPSHIIFQKNKKITSCSYQVSEKLDRTKNKVSGKSKRGAQPMQKNSYLCRLTCDDGSVYMIRCCMNGKLLEINEKLLEDPEMLKKEPHFGGYIAIVLPNLRYHDEQLKKQLLDQKQYKEALSKRNENKDQEHSVLEDNKNKEENKDKEILVNTETSQKDKNIEQSADIKNIDKKQGKEETDNPEMVEVNQME